jgi:hypothetical protein
MTRETNESDLEDGWCGSADEQRNGTGRDPPINDHFIPIASLALHSRNNIPWLNHLRSSNRATL